MYHEKDICPLLVIPVARSDMSEKGAGVRPLLTSPPLIPVCMGTKGWHFQSSQSSGLGEYLLDERRSADAVQARTIVTVLPEAL